MVINIDNTLTALADPTRRRVVELLRERPRRVGELSAIFDISGPAMSKHLRILRTSGLIEEQPIASDARVRIYRLRPEPFTALQSWLKEVETFWTGQLDAFKEYAERTQKG